MCISVITFELVSSPQHHCSQHHRHVHAQHRPACRQPAHRSRLYASDVHVNPHTTDTRVYTRVHQPPENLGLTSTPSIAAILSTLPYLAPEGPAFRYSWRAGSSFHLPQLCPWYVRWCNTQWTRAQFLIRRGCTSLRVYAPEDLQLDLRCSLQSTFKDSTHQH